MKTRDLARMGLFVALLAICSWISIPATVEFTMQTFAVFACLQLLGSGRAALTLLVYLLLGAIGVPVFAGFQGGVSALLGPTGGYLIGFIAMAGVYRLFGADRTESLWRRVAALAVSLVVLYAFGTVWFVAVYSAREGSVTYLAALSWCVFPFIIPDCLKLALSVVLSERLKKTGIMG